MKKEKKMVYIYTRVSTAMQVDGFSLDAQKEKLKKYADYQDMVVVREFSDEGKSGKNVDGRPQFKEMLELIEAGTDDIDYVLIMTINPGTPGQTFIEKSLEKIANLKKMIGSRPIQIEVDGGVNDVIAKQVAGAGAELIVVGGYLFGGNPGERYSILREAVK